MTLEPQPIMANPIDTIAAKAKGMKHGMDARRDGLVGVFRTLAKEHAEAKELFERIQAKADKREALWPKLRDALIPHEKGELRAVYPRLSQYPELQGICAEHQREADALEKQILALDAMSPETSDWAAKLDALAADVISHATLEETDFFPTAQRSIGDAMAKQLDDDFAAAKKQVKASLPKH
jgi:hypothetical protein